MTNKEKIRKQFENEILTRPIIIDNDFDAHLCAAYIYSKLGKDIDIVGIKDRERDKNNIKQFGLTGSALYIKSVYDYGECSFLDFEVHGCPSIGQHMLLKWDDEILGPNKEFKLNGEKDLGKKYPMNTIIYIMYLYDDLKNYSDDDIRYIAIPDKTYQNSWKDKVYINPEPKRCQTKNCNSRTFVEMEIRPDNMFNGDRRIVKVCAKCGRIPYLRGYRDNFKWWESIMNLEMNLYEKLAEKEFYDYLYQKYPHIYGKYPDLDIGGKALLNLILSNIGWELPNIPDDHEYNKYYLIPEYRMVPLHERVPDDVFHHARLDLYHMYVSRTSEIRTKNL